MEIPSLQIRSSTGCNLSVRLVQTFLHQQTIEADTMEILSNRDDHGRLLETLDNI